MPRRPRLFVPGATYHVYCRVARGEFVFDNAEEADGFIEALQQVRDLDGWQIVAWCLMGNHYHIVTTTDRVPLWRSMLRFQAQVARGFNRRRGYLGRLWQSRYRARVIDTQEYFQQVVAYVHLNPVAAGVVKDPASYRYSGHAAVMGLAQPRLIDLSAVLNGFGGLPWANARRRYVQWLRAVSDARWCAAGLDELPWWKHARDVDEIATRGQARRAITHDGRTLEETRPRLGLDELCRRYETVSGHAIEDLASRRRRRTILQGRIELTVVAIDRYGLPSFAVADALDKDPASVSRWLRSGLLLQREDDAFRQRIDTLDRAIAATLIDLAAHATKP